jgi:transposase InsO family protein
MSDNALCYTRSHQFRDALTNLGAHHIRIPAYTHAENGKIERFFQTLDTEWVHSRTWPTSATRDRAGNVHALLQPQTPAHRRQRPSPITRIH